MTGYETALTALADPTRRNIFESLRAAPRTVGALAEVLPVSRPAVSQHLKILKAAGLVRVESRGTRNVYSVRADGLDELRQYLASFWSEALDAYTAEVTRRTKHKPGRRTK